MISRPLREIADLQLSPPSQQPEPDLLVRLVPDAALPPFPITITADHTRLVPFHRVPAGAVAIAPGDLVLRRVARGSRWEFVAVAMTDGYLGDSAIVVRPKPHVQLPGNAPLWKWLRYALIWAYGRILETDDKRRVLAIDRLAGLQIPFPEGLADSLTILDEAFQLLHLRREANRKRAPILGALLTEQFGKPHETGHSVTPRRSLGELALVRIGTGLPSMTPYFDGHIPLVDEADLYDDEIHETERALTDAGLRATGAPLVEANSILLSTNASGTGLLRVPAAISETVAAITLLDPDYPPELLWHWLRLSKPYIQQMVREAAVPGLTSDLIRRIPIPVAPVSVYQQTARAISELDALEAAAGKQARMLSGMLSTLLKQSMSERRTTGSAVRAGKLPADRKQSDRLVRAALSELRRRPIWSRLSAAQQSVARACLSLAGPFSVDELTGAMEDAPDREKLLHTLELLVYMGVLIKDGRPEVDHWRQPHPEFDREVQV